MLTIFSYSLARLRGQFIGWGLALAILGGYLVGFYDTFAGQQEQMSQLLQNYPPELMAMFGGMTDMFTPHGFLNVEFFSYMPLILGIFAILNGSGLLTADEESGKLDLIAAHPLSRIALFMGRILAFTAATLAILLVTWLGFILVVPGTTMDISPAKMALPFISLLAILMLFGMLALFFSMVLPSRRLAAMTTGLLLVVSFFLTAFASLDPSLEAIANFSPLKYYQGGNALIDMEWTWIGGLLGSAVLFLLLAWWLFERRDIRVGGEGGWKLPTLLSRSRTSHTSPKTM
jgi:ABC-2 type transport system permease protein